MEASVEKGSNPAKLAGPNTPSDKKLTEYFVKGTAPSTVSKTYEKEEKEETAKLSGLNVKYDKDNQSLTLSWNYDGDATFAVKQSVDGGSYSEIQNSSAKEAVISGVQPGSVYKFEVTAVSDDGKSTASTSYEVPKAEDDEDKKTSNKRMMKNKMMRRLRMIHKLMILKKMTVRRIKIRQMIQQTIKTKNKTIRTPIRPTTITKTNQTITITTTVTTRIRRMVIRTLVRMIQQVLTRIKIKQTHLIKPKQTHHQLKKQINQKSRHLWGDGFFITQ